MPQAVPVLYKQVGWMRCVACSDWPRFPGRMWLGKEPNGTDITCECPACNGRGEVPRFKILDALTGEEIDYEYFGKDENGNPIQPQAITATSLG
jgi:hypothetical protein